MISTGHTTFLQTNRHQYNCERFYHVSLCNVVVEKCRVQKMNDLSNENQLDLQGHIIIDSCVE